MNKQISMTPEQLFFAVFCIEALADDLETSGDQVYKMLTVRSGILDSYIIPFYDVLHTQGKEYIIREIKDILKERGVEL